MNTVSVAMAAWNGAAWIGPQLDSLLTQTRLPDEIVICDDSPDDATGNVVRKYRERFSQIRYFHNRERLGVCRNFEEAIRRTTGDFIFLADQDDVWDSGKIERLAAELEVCPDCELVFCNSRVTDAALKALSYTAWEIQRCNPGDCGRLSPDAVAELQLIHPFGYAHDMAMRRTLLAVALPFPDLGACHDFWLAGIAAARGTLRIIPESLTSYRCHGGNLTELRQPGLKERWRDLRAGGREELSRTASLYLELDARLGECAPAAVRGALVHDLAIFYSERATGRWYRIPRALYRRFSRGWRSLLRDIFAF